MVMSVAIFIAANAIESANPSLEIDAEAITFESTRSFSKNTRWNKRVFFNSSNFEL